MSSRTADLETIARWALEVAKDSVPLYYHRFAPKVFSRPQLVACVLLKTYLRQDYRGMEEILRVSPPLQNILGLKRVPDYSTLSRAFKAVSRSALEGMLEAVLKRTGISQSDAAVDSTGFQAGTASAYYHVRRGVERGKRRRGWVKLSLVVLLPSLLVASARPTWAWTNDKTAFIPTMQPAVERVRIRKLFADAGYDAEWIHDWCRNRHGIESWIPPILRSPIPGRVGGFWRKHMARGLPKEYGRRWGVETVNSVIKRKWGGATTARTRAGQRREAVIKTVVYAIHR